LRERWKSRTTVPDRATVRSEDSLRWRWCKPLPGVDMIGGATPLVEVGSDRSAFGSPG